MATILAMTPFLGKNLDSDIIELLSKGPLQNKRLLGMLQTQGRTITKQGFYFSLRKLMKNGVLVTHNKQSALNVRWLSHMEHFFAFAKSQYVASKGISYEFLNFSDGESVEYSFRNPETTDLFWWDALYMLQEKFDVLEPVYLYNPHEWFLIARHESEFEMINLISKKRKLLVAVSGKTYLDKFVMRYFDGKIAQYHMLDQSFFPKNNYYCNCIGDFVIEVWIDPLIASKIDNFYLSNNSYGDDVVSRLKEIIQEQGRSRLRISRNTKKAEIIKKKFKNYFVI